MTEPRVYTGLSLPVSKMNRLDQLAKSMSLSRTGMIALLVESAEIEPARVSVLGKNNRRDAKVSEATSITAVGA